MTTTALIASLVFLLGLGLGAAAIWFVLRYKKAAGSKVSAEKTIPADTMTFHWKYVLLPVSILLLSLALIAYFYHLLPAEVAWRFNADGEATKWMGRSAIIIWLLVPQLLLGLTSGAVTLGMMKLAQQASQVAGSSTKPQMIIPVMGNMIVMPQLVLAFVMANIFSYNVYEARLMPIWLFALIVMIVGGIILAIFFISAIRQAQISAKSSAKNPKE